jgi:hypothetical protein
MSSTHFNQPFMVNNDASPCNPTLTSHTPFNPQSPKLYKAFLNDPTRSDVTVRFGDKMVYAHRHVLCRGSEYFARMLTGRFQVSLMPSSPQMKFFKLT